MFAGRAGQGLLTSLCAGRLLRHCFRKAVALCLDRFLIAVTAHRAGVGFLACLRAGRFLRHFRLILVRKLFDFLSIGVAAFRAGVGGLACCRTGRFLRHFRFILVRKLFDFLGKGVAAFGAGIGPLARLCAGRLLRHFRLILVRKLFDFLGIGVAAFRAGIGLFARLCAGRLLCHLFCVEVTERNLFLIALRAAGAGPGFNTGFRAGCCCVCTYKRVHMRCPEGHQSSSCLELCVLQRLRSAVGRYSAFYSLDLFLYILGFYGLFLRRTLGAVILHLGDGDLDSRRLFRGDRDDLLGVVSVGIIGINSRIA